MVLIVVRSKLVLDFALTTHLLHLIIVSLYTGQLPRNFFWYATMTASSAVGVALGIWGCQYRELRPVFFGGGGAAASSAANGSAAGRTSGEGAASSAGGGGAAAGEPLGDEEQGFGRGRGRGRGRDGAGEYEMIKMNGEAAP